jgi:phage recombination protein Bet
VNALTTTTETRALAQFEPFRFDEKETQLIKDTVCRGSTDLELQFFLAQCKRTGLDPLTRQIYSVERFDTNLGRTVRTTQVSIDGFRLISQRTGEYAGMVGPFWCDTDGVWVDVWLKPYPPSAAKVGVLRRGFAEPLYAVAKFDSYKQTKKDGNLTSMWKKMPELMISKCAESLARRMAFPQELSGLYTSEEMGQAENVHVQTVEPVQSKISRPELISDEDVETLMVAIHENGVDVDAFLAFFKCGDLQDLTREQFSNAMRLIEKKAKRKKESNIDQEEDDEDDDSEYVQHDSHTRALNLIAMRAQAETGVPMEEFLMKLHQDSDIIHSSEVSQNKAQNEKKKQY